MEDVKNLHEFPDIKKWVPDGTLFGINKVPAPERLSGMKVVTEKVNVLYPWDKGHYLNYKWRMLKELAEDIIDDAGLYRKQLLGKLDDELWIDYDDLDGESYVPPGDRLKKASGPVPPENKITYKESCQTLKNLYSANFSDLFYGHPVEKTKTETILANNTGAAICKKCNQVNEYTEPSPDYVCYACR